MARAFVPAYLFLVSLTLSIPVDPPIIVAAAPDALPSLPSDVPQHLRILSPPQYQQWLEDGFTVFERVVDRSIVDQLAEEIPAFLGVDPESPATWRACKPINPMGMVEMFSSPAQWRARTTPRMHAAWADLWDTEAVQISLNRANFNIPVGAGFQREDVFHWDVHIDRDTFNPAIQGVLAVSDVAEEGGTFVCVPGSHRAVAAWRDAGRPAPAPSATDLATRMGTRRVPARAGDLIVWSQALVHGNGANRSSRPRLAAYIGMTPAGTVRTNETGLQARSHGDLLDSIECWALGPWLPALASALGCSQAVVHSWARSRCAGESSEGLPLPHRGAPGASSLLSVRQREAIDRVLPHVPIPPLRPGGEACTRWAEVPRQVFRYCEQLGRTITALTGIEILPGVPQPLDALGQRILGRKPWPAVCHPTNRRHQ